MTRRRLLTAALALPTLGSAHPARSATWPERPVRVIVPFGAGGGAECPAQAPGHVFVQGGGHDAADVVGFENGGSGLH